MLTRRSILTGPSEPPSCSLHREAWLSSVTMRSKEASLGLPLLGSCGWEWGQFYPEGPRESNNTQAQGPRREPEGDVDYKCRVENPGRHQAPDLCLLRWSFYSSHNDSVGPGKSRGRSARPGQCSCKWAYSTLRPSRSSSFLPASGCGTRLRGQGLPGDARPMAVTVLLCTLLKSPAGIHHRPPPTAQIRTTWD